MELCSAGHDEICFEGGRYTSCPLCCAKAEMQDEIKDLQKEIVALQAEIDQIKGING